MEHKLTMDAPTQENGTGYTIPLNIITLIFVFLSKITPGDLASVVAILSGAVGTGYVIYKWRRDMVIAHREDEEYKEEHPEIEED